MANDYFKDHIYFTPHSTLHFDTAKQSGPNNEITTVLKLFNRGSVQQGQNLAYKIKTTQPKSY